jgi:hypothetical protein
LAIPEIALAGDQLDHVEYERLARKLGAGSTILITCFPYFVSG